MEMIPNKGYYVGRFNEKDIRAGLDKKSCRKSEGRNWFELYKSRNCVQEPKANCN